MGWIFVVMLMAVVLFHFVVFPVDDILMKAIGTIMFPFFIKKVERGNSDDVYDALHSYAYRYKLYNEFFVDGHRDLYCWWHAKWSPAILDALKEHQRRMDEFYETHYYYAGNWHYDPR